MAKKKKATATITAGTKWQTATDPKTGRTYYYHIETRETQWRKPIELATPAERRVVEEKEKRQRDFFAAMEANILNSITTGVYANEKETEAATKSGKKVITAVPITEQQLPSPVDPGVRLERPNLMKPQLVRTISTMDENVLKDLVDRVPSHSLLCSRSDFKYDYDDYGDDLPNNSKDLYNYNDDDDVSPSTVVNVNMTQMSRPSRVSRLGSIREDTEVSEMAIAARIVAEADGLERAISTGSATSISSDNQSIGGLLRSLPDSSNQNGKQSFELSTIMDQSLDDREVQALRQLANISETMAHVQDDSDGCTSQSISPISETNSRVRDQSTKPHKFDISNKSASLPLEALERPRPIVTRRNTCGTLYVGSTMAAPDKDATIKCVCAVYRAHILQSTMEGVQQDENEDYHIFNDFISQQRRGYRLASDTRDCRMPTMEEVSHFYADVFRRAQMESDCIIMSLIYVERLIKTTGGALRPRPSNWRSVLFSCMVLASKVWDDMSMWNTDFSQTCPAGVKFSLQRVNALEVAVLSALKFSVKVPASEYAKYYFLLRSMLIKSGLGGEEAATPLDVEGAKRLQHVSSLYQTVHANMLGTNDEDRGGGSSPRMTHSLSMRSKSIGSLDTSTKKAAALVQDQVKGKVGLEHLVKM